MNESDRDATENLDDIRDELPDDLDVTAFTVPYEFPNNNRRRIPAALYAVMGLGAVVFVLANDGSPLVNGGLLVAGVALVVFAVYGVVAGRTLEIDETEALTAMSNSIGFPVGHASAQMAWRGLASRPVWRVLAYSTENPPTQRAMAVVDGTNGVVLEWFAEPNPEVWLP